MIVHIQLANGMPKCGARNCLPYFATNTRPATCKSCLGQRQKVETVSLTGDWKGKIFRRSFGYDMTINVFCVVVKQDAKSLVAVECEKTSNGEEYGWRSEGKASTTGKPKEGAKPFRLFLKRNTYGEYWSGDGENWWEWDGRPCYENHCD